jgi:hypothetical protein
LGPGGGLAGGCYDGVDAEEVGGTSDGA